MERKASSLKTSKKQERPVFSWYPPHMEQGRKAISKSLKGVEVVLEVRDSRLPQSSASLGLEGALRRKPRIILCTKKDLVDPQLMKLWKAHWKKHPPAKELRGIFWVNLNEKRALERVKDHLQLGMNKEKILERLMVLGIPNCGKSTLINRLLGRKSLGVAARPGFTKRVNWVSLGSGCQVMDSPGILWPKIERKAQFLGLGWIGALPLHFLDVQGLSLELYAWMLKHYPALLEAKGFSTKEPLESKDFFLQLGKSRGWLKKRGEVHEEQSQQSFLEEVGLGKWGKLGFEFPEGFLKKD